MSSIWKFETSPFPPLLSYHDLAGDDHPDGKDTWITTANLGVLTHIPGVPSAYAAEDRAGLVLYVRGVPFNIPSNAFRDIFMPFGKVNKSPVLICLGSFETFRWVVMKHADDAQDVVKALHGSTHESGCQLFISMSIAPGKVFELKEQKLPGGYQKAKENQEGAVSHAHPSLPAVQPSKSLLPPIPRIAVPAIIQPVQGVSKPAYPPGLSPRPAAQKPLVVSNQQAPIPPPVEKVEVPDDEQGGSSSSYDNTTTKARPPPKASLIPSSWANIASSSDPKTRVIDLHPEHKSNNVGPRINTQGQTPTVVDSRAEPLADQMRLIFILNLPHNIGLHEITQAVTEGPLVKIQFAYDEDTKDRFVGIIFLYADHADVFYNALIRERERSRPVKFRFIVDVVKGDPYPADDNIRSMLEDPWATRRLTIVKGRFFFMFGERQLKDLCVKIAGEDNVQLVWLYNGGNATVVFADVESAIKVKKVLDVRANDGKNASKNAGENSDHTDWVIWKGLQTTFSKDPCVHPLDLKTAMHD
ncbi:hypothetical protein VTL71DRAFT_5435 [Oculimacula yallundae]|uniref:RRM domain-containing protein n=1 Tax=Oculimacula yallundae TaxID=86028 RepID=A0ABR4C134_9HELO